MLTAYWRKSSVWKRKNSLYCRSVRFRIVGSSSAGASPPRQPPARPVAKNRSMPAGRSRKPRSRSWRCSDAKLAAFTWFTQSCTFGQCVTADGRVDLSAAALTDVHEWFKAYYGPNNAVIVIAGDIDPATARQKVEKYFGAIPPSPPIAKQDKWVAKMTGTHRGMMHRAMVYTNMLRVCADDRLTLLVGGRPKAVAATNLTINRLFDSHVLTSRWLVRIGEQAGDGGAFVRARRT